MEIDRILADSSIYVCSRNPIAVWAINNLLLQRSFSWHVLRFFARPVPRVTSGVHIALFDAASIPEWPELIPKWTSAGYKVILVAIAHWGGGAGLRALHLGVAGVVDVTTEFGDRLVDAITLVASGRLYAKEDIVRNPKEPKIANTASSGQRLSFREEQVLDLLILGFSNKRIGTVLGITERTAKFHVCNIMRKLRVTRRGDVRTIDRNIVPKVETKKILKVPLRVALSG